MPLKPSKNSTIFGTIDRGDMRDMLFIKKKSIDDLKKEALSIFTSSPRRKYISEIILTIPDLESFLPILNSKNIFSRVKGFEPINLNLKFKVFPLN